MVIKEMIFLPVVSFFLYNSLKKHSVWSLSQWSFTYPQSEYGISDTVVVKPLLFSICVFSNSLNPLTDTRETFIILLVDF